MTTFSEFWWDTKINREFLKTSFGMEMILPQSGMILRRAVETDYEGIMGISEGVLGGRDYLPDLYHCYLRDPDRYLYVSQKEGQMAAFMMFHIIDKGTTLYEGGGRRAPKFRGNLAVQALRIYGLLEVVRLRPTLRKSRWVSGHIGYWTSPESRHMMEACSKILYSKYVTLIDDLPLEKMSNILREDLLQSLATRLPMSDVTVADQTDLKTTFTKYKEIFPGDIIQAGPETYEVMLHNIKVFLTEGCNTIVNKDHKCLSTFFTQYCPVGLYINWKIYGEITPGVMMAHLLAFLPIMLKTNKRKRGILQVRVVYPATVNFDLDHLGSLVSSLPSCPALPLKPEDLVVTENKLQ